MNDLADKLFGTKRAETTKVSSNSETITLYGTAVSDSEDGTVSVVMSDSVYLVEDDLGGDDATTTIEMPTHITVREGDEVAITLVGNSTAKSPVVSGVVGGGDRQQVEIDAAKKAADDATEAIGGIEDEIQGVKDDIQTFKDKVEADYYKSEYIDDNFSTVEEVGAVYRDSMARNLSPFYSHDFTDVSTTDTDAYWHTLTTSKTEQLTDGWAHVTLDNASGTGGMYAYATVRTPFLPIVAGTLMVEIRNVQVAAEGRWGIGRTVQGLTFTALDVTEDGTYYRPCTVNDPAPANGVAMSLRFYAFAGVSVEFDARISYYQGEYTGDYKPYNADTANLTREYATKTWTEQTAEDYSIGAAQKYTATIANANLSPLTAHDTKDRYNATTNPDGYWVANISQYANIEDGWVHVERAAASGTQWAQQFETVLLANLKPSTKYTLLMEYRNVSVTGTLTGWAVYRSTTQFAQPVDNSFAISEDMAKRVVIETKADYEGITSGVDVRHRLVAPSGGDGSCSYDIRLSLYECATDSEGETIPYDGPYKPYVTDQQALAKEYATQSQLTVGLNGILTTVSQTYETKDHAGLTYANKTTTEQTFSEIDTRVTATEDGLAVQETLIRQYAGGVLVAYTGNPVGALVNAAGQYDIVSLTWQGGEPTVGTTLAKFGQESQIGQESETFLDIDSRSMRLTDGASSQTYFEAADLRGDDGVATLTSTYIADGITATQAYEIFILPLESIEEVTGVTLDGTATTRFYVQNLNEVVVENTTKGQAVAITYTTESVLAKAYTLGIRRGGSDVGAMSVAEGIYTMAQGAMAHAEGSWTQANGEASHAGGESTTANGPRSFAHGTDVVADLDSQFVVGKYNALGLNSLFEVGTGDPTMRESGFWVGEDGATRIGTYGTAIAGVFFGSKVVDPAGAAYATLFTSTEAVTEFGQAPNAARDIVVLTNGDPNAYQGQMTAALTGGNIRAYFSPTKNGNIRVNYLVIIGA